MENTAGRLDAYRWRAPAGHSYLQTRTRRGLGNGATKKMARILIGGLVVAIIAALLFFLYAGSYRTRNQAQEQQISELNNQLNKLQHENEQLKTALASVQAEGITLAAQNEEMRKAIASFKATGKLPPTLPPAK